MNRIIAIVAAVITVVLGAVVLIGNPADATRLLAIAAVSAGAGILAGVI